MHQDRYLKDLYFTFADYRPTEGNDHDHCEFCGTKFSLNIEGSLTSGWCDIQRYRWVCESCFKDFEQPLKLKRR